MNFAHMVLNGCSSWFTMGTSRASTDAAVFTPVASPVAPAHMPGRAMNASVITALGWVFELVSSQSHGAPNLTDICRQHQDARGDREIGPSVRPCVLSG